MELIHPTQATAAQSEERMMDSYQMQIFTQVSPLVAYTQTAEFYP